MPRRLIAILLLLSLSYQSFVKLGIVIWYECNRDYVAKNLCENRNRPEMKCYGKCYLCKQLKKADREDNKSNNVPEKWNMGEVMVYVMPAPIFQLPFTALPVRTSIPLANERYGHQQSPGDIFHPPLSAC